jgi:hypothetical protein
MNSPSTAETALFKYRLLGAEQLRQYDQQGYLVLPSVLTKAELATVLDECMQAWRAAKQAFDPGKTWLQNSLLHNIHHVSPAVRRFYFAGPLVDVAEQLIGPNVKAASSQLTFKMAGNTMPFGWHQDNGYGQLDPPTALTALTALDDTDRQNGCLWLIPGSHRQGQVEIRMTPEQKAAGLDLSLPVDDRQAVPMPLAAGEALIFHAWMLHKSDGNLSADRDRRILFMRYADADAVEVYNERRPRLGRLLRGATRFPEVRAFEADLASPV